MLPFLYPFITVVGTLSRVKKFGAVRGLPPVHPAEGRLVSQDVFNRKYIAT